MDAANPPEHGVVLFAHGSRDPAWRAPIEAVAERMRALKPQVPVQCAYLELTTPDLATAVQLLRDTGVRAVSIWPMFLGVGRHVREDLPRLVEDLRHRHPDTQFTLRPAIAEHADVLDSMARTALNELPP